MGADTSMQEREKQIILIVDGDSTRQFFTAVFLQRFNYHVFPVKTAEAALMITELTVPLLVITDITLPQMNGIDLLKTLKQNPRTREVPLLIYTGLKSPAYREECKQAGCAGYLTEPADHNQLYEAVQKATETTPRHYVRLDTSLDVIVESSPLDGSGERREKVTALSEHGMFVSSQQPLPFSSTSPFTLILDRAAGWKIKVEGKILVTTQVPFFNTMLTFDWTHTLVCDITGSCPTRLSVKDASLMTAILSGCVPG